MMKYVLVALLLANVAYAGDMKVDGVVEITDKQPEKKETAQGQGFDENSMAVLEAFVTGKSIPGCQGANFYYMDQNGRTRCGKR